jgi:hypothetical protein
MQKLREKETEKRNLVQGVTELERFATLFQSFIRPAPVVMGRAGTSSNETCQELLCLNAL